MSPIPVLLYHRVADDDGPNTTRTSVFREHLACLAGEGFQPLTTKAFTEAVESGRDPGPRRYFMTFDDGDRSVSAIVDDLARHAVQPLSFLITDRVGRDAECLDWNTALRWQQEGVFAFASHSHRHEPWTFDRSGTQAVADDLATARRVLQERLGPGAFDDHLAWPWGRCTPDFEAAAAAAGYRWQYLVQRCAVARPGQRVRLPRACADGWSASQLRSSLRAMSTPVLSTVTRLATSAVRRYRHGLAY